jgi:hypothetical protein
MSKTTKLAKRLDNFCVIRDNLERLWINLANSRRLRHKCKDQIAETSDLLVFVEDKLKETLKDYTLSIRERD